MAEKLDLTRFEKRMVIRNIREEDIDRIIALQEVCFPGMDPWKKSTLKATLNISQKASSVRNSRRNHWLMFKFIN